MIDAALPFLRCPVCAGALRRAVPAALRCPRGHSFDIARQGYASLTAGRSPHSGDSAEMVADRERFLAAGHYDFIADALADAAQTTVAQTTAAQTTAAASDAVQTAGAGTAGAEGPAGGGTGLVIDAGTGTGRYLSAVLERLPAATGLGLDVSKPALRRAARAHPRAAAVHADLWRPLPLADGAADLVLDVFAPRNGPEFRRVLRPGGALLVVTPAADHLAELVEGYGLVQVDPDKAERVANSLSADFVEKHRRVLRKTLRLNGDEARTLIGMTPSARHVAAAELPTGDVTVTAAVELTVYC
ncbi:23S rRNA (guanine745-N1)-methyltransferase [Krasilnikovia cinnamomea]|uniref:23S rRNA (Guanine745-N1)-methyltransferase n=1 Tax=Krasilnikovia cinnamomea TaxID=349313 RepID=A0A4Q7ZHL0_9ACTN|nr:methyltransferase domain-containing protein [Krasilnikovia cinnamomea]RZU50287.1 23S rRNA (guanine745-N1)-methyltransferase [Krasilnikovia cinnamomea]